MKRKLLGICLGFIAATIFGARPVEAQQAKGMPRIAYVYLFDTGPSAPFFEAFAARMRELGWVDGRNIVIANKGAGGSQEKLAAIMRELVDSKVDLILAVCTPEAKAAMKVTTTIPVVVAATGDAVKAGLVESLAKPGGNVTGVSNQLLELSGKRIQMLKEVVPSLKRATILWNPVRGDNRLEAEAMQAAARDLGVQLDSKQVRDAGEFDAALAAMSRDGTQAFTESGDTLMSSETHRLIDFSVKNRMPAIYDDRGYADAGGLMSYGPNLPDSHRLAAEYVDKILKGANPANLPMQQATRFELVINMKTARALGLTIPQQLLQRADEVIQ